jgi:serine/threonine-protein kinase
MDTIERTLLRGGEMVALTPKEFDLLLLLIENRGHVVEKERLMQEIWPDSFVEEGNLTTNISTLRKALDEAATGQRYIQTLPKRGYRFVGQVTEVMDEGSRPTGRDESKLITEQGDEVRRGDGGKRGRRETQDVSPSLRQRFSALPAKALTAVAVLATTVVIGLFWMMNKPKPAYSNVGMKTIAVLPFKPLAADSRNESLEMGMADTLINKLSPISQLIVRPISAIRRYTSLEQDPIAAGRELRVDYVLEGNLQMEGEKTRATVRLLSVKDGSAIWTDKCDQACSNVFELQDAIAERIARSLSLQLSGEEAKQLAKHYTENAEAYRLYNLGAYNLRRFTREGFDKSIECNEQAIKIDPHYAMAYIGLAKVYASFGQRGFWLPNDARQKYGWAAQKALELDDTLAEAHGMLAYAKKTDWDWAGAEKENKRALELDPNSHDANFSYFAFLRDVGRLDEALPYAKRAEELGGANHEPDVAVVFLYKRQYDAAIELFLKELEANPDGSYGAFTHSRLGEAYVAKGMYEEGIAEILKAAALHKGPDELGGSQMLAHAYAVAGKRDEALKILNELKESAKHQYVSAVHFAVIYTGLGDKDRAFEYLEKAYEERAQNLLQLRNRPMFDSLRMDPRYKDLLRRMNLAP